jgi:hypothetical protein
MVFALPMVMVFALPMVMVFALPMVMVFALPMVMAFAQTSEWGESLQAPTNLKIKLYLITSGSAVVFLARRRQVNQGKPAINNRGIKQKCYLLTGASMPQLKSYPCFLQPLMRTNPVVNPGKLGLLKSGSIQVIYISMFIFNHDI